LLHDGFAQEGLQFVETKILEFSDIGIAAGRLEEARRRFRKPTTGNECEVMAVGRRIFGWRYDVGRARSEFCCRVEAKQCRADEN